MNLFEEKISTEKIYDGIIIDLNLDEVKLPDGKSGKREYVIHPGGVGIIAINENDEILFVRQYRYPYKKLVLEIPAGKKDKDEQPLDAGKRELKEETGATAKDYCHLGEVYPSPGYTNEIINIYAAKNLSFGNKNLDEDEFLEVEKIKLDKACKMVLDNEITDAKTIIAILKLKELRDKGLF